MADIIATQKPQAKSLTSRTHTMPGQSLHPV